MKQLCMSLHELYSMTNVQKKFTFSIFKSFDSHVCLYPAWSVKIWLIFNKIMSYIAVAVHFKLKRIACQIA